MSQVELTGRLVCQNSAEAGLVAQLLPAHTSLTRAEPGCLLFEVAQTSDPLVWQVDERFDSEGAFRQHQHRVAASEWGRMTAQIARDYTVTGVAE